MAKYIIKRREFIQPYEARGYFGIKKGFSFGKWKTIEMYDSLENARNHPRKSKGLHQTAIFYNNKKIEEL
jgi:hypothetical protein